MNHKFCAGIVIEKWIYFSEIQFNGLFKLNIHTGNVIFLGFFTRCGIKDQEIHRKAIRLANKIVFIPQSGNLMHYYELDTGRLFDIPNKDNDVCGRLFSTGIIIQNRLYLIPMSHNCELSYISKKTMQVEIDMRFHDYLSKFKGIDKDIAKRAVRKERHVYFGIYGENQIVDMDIDSGSISQKTTNIENINSIYYSKHGFWVTSNNDTTIYHYNNEDIVPYRCEDEIDHTDEDMAYAQIIETKGGDVYAIRNGGLYIYKLERNIFKKMVLPIEYRLEKYGNGKILFFEYDYIGEGICIFPVAGNALLKINRNNVEMIYIKRNEYDRKYLSNIMQEIDSSQIINEDSIFGLKGLIKITTMS